MFKIFIMLLAFIKELFIKNKNEINILHYQFSFKKTIKFAVVVLSFLLNYLLINALINVTSKYNHLQDLYTVQKPIKESNILVDDLHEELHACQQQVLDISIMLDHCNTVNRKNTTH